MGQQGPAHAIWGCAALMIVAQTCFRAWALAGSWWTGADLDTMVDASAPGLDPGALFAPVDGRVSPVARLLGEVVSASSPPSWLAAVAISLALTVAADLACLWLLVSVVGPRWRLLVGLGAYLVGGLTVPVLLQWTAGVGALCSQAAVLAAAACVVRFRHERRARWLSIAALLALLSLGGSLVGPPDTAAVAPFLVILLAAGLAGSPATLRPRILVAALVTLALATVVGGGVAIRDTTRAHASQPARDYLDAARTGLLGKGLLDLADQQVPQQVVPRRFDDASTLSRLLPLFADNVRFPATTLRLVVVDPAGVPRIGRVDATASSPPGPAADCGWRVASGSTTVPLTGQTPEGTWWMRIAYLSSATGSLRLTVEDDVIEAPIRQGLGNTYVRASGRVGSVRLDGVAATLTVCVDVIEVGVATPGDLL